MPLHPAAKSSRLAQATDDKDFRIAVTEFGV